MNESSPQDYFLSTPNSQSNSNANTFKREISSNSLKSLPLSGISKQQQTQLTKLNIIKDLQIKLMDSQKEINVLKY